MAVAVCLAGILMLCLGKGHDEAAARETAAQTGTVQLTPDQYGALTFATASPRDFHDIASADGKITTNDDQTVSVYSPYTGRVVAVMVEPGQRVTKGQPLFAIAANEYVQARSDLSALEANLSAARSQEALADAAEKRAEGVYRTAGGALKDYEQAQHDLIAARGAAQAAQSALQSEKEKLGILGVSSNELGSATFGGKDIAVVRAPISGLVVQRAVSPGLMITGTGTLTITLTDISSVWLQAQVSESDAGKIAVGQTVSVHVTAYPDKAYTARIRSVAPSLDPDTHRLPVRAEITNTDGALKPEMFASFDISGDRTQTALAIPVDAVIREGDQARVWVVDTDRTAHCRPVTLGLVNSGFAQILTGLAPGERVVVKGGLFVDKAGLG
ncbi:efflux RND transporter periplasmic adaptor subunit [Asticcacaulis sp. 201]|uniref:efflux RND transporter periplasmic adaptor subunit n=1 Tax=Asticcacaulis sp. 201 TaxID=3028787 RepID=UPI002915DA9C|nr:efflux RND transporter periplasmic adaptor subunit [Asticcacaulis sp. 201]MDV6331005.1 efflux RND transporter periplasmic adaptor subunit [Asticcacaulis sp. 201]